MPLELMMLLQPLSDTLKAIKNKREAGNRVVHLTPQGQTLNQDKLVELAAVENLLSRSVIV